MAKVIFICGKMCSGKSTYAEQLRVQNNAVLLTCDESNIASYKTIEKLGAELIEIVKPPEDYFAYRENMERQRIYKLQLSEK